MEHFGNDYQQGKEVLEDLRHLGDTNLAPLISRAHHHLFEIKRKAESNLKNPDLYSNVNDILNTHVENMIHLYLKKNQNLSTVNLNLDSGKWGLHDWNMFVEIIPTILTTCSQFDFLNTVSFYQMGRNFFMTGALALGSDISKNRRNLYGLFRKFVSKKVLMTYELSESTEEGVILCTLKFNLSHRDDVVYFLPVGQHSLFNLALTNLFADYTVEDFSALQGVKHTCIKINEKFETEKLETIPDDLFEKNPGCELFHFPFLFHPVSMIIPEQGFLKVLDDYHTNKSIPGTEFRQDNKSCLQKPFHYIDFFELITD
ncbi:MAG: hypothetical protein KC493_03450 [Bacteriovoracaceae bacterium]|nr:hypothetical protein [Bacteriovoracaceae bacterium]